MSSLGCYLLYTHILQCTPASLGLVPPGSAAVLREERGGEGRGGREGKESPGRSGGTARHYRLPKQQQALLNPMCNNPATTVPGLFPEQKLVCAMWFGGFSVWFLGGWGKMYLTRPSPHPLSIQAEVKGWHGPGTKSPLSSFTCLDLSVLVTSQALSRTRLLGLFHW